MGLLLHHEQEAFRSKPEVRHQRIGVDVFRDLQMIDNCSEGLKKEKKAFTYHKPTWQRQSYC
jgi:hypothetical protein